MSGIEGIIGSSSGSLQTLESNTMGKDDFLKMMIAQLQHQDPLNPLDGTDFTAQLAQFSSLEQLSNMNTQLETLGLYQSSLNNAQSISLIGKEVTARGNIVKVDGAASADLARLKKLLSVFMMRQVILWILSNLEVNKRGTIRLRGIAVVSHPAIISLRYPQAMRMETWFQLIP